MNKQRGRKSAAALAVVPLAPKSTPGRLRPPEHLPETERELFSELVASCASDHFVASDLPLLTEYCVAVVLARQAAAELQAAGAVVNNRPSAWIVVQEKAVRAMVALSQRLRLAPLSRLKAEAVGRHRGAATPNYLDVVRSLGAND
jgi:phage terminase small subunit